MPAFLLPLLGFAKSNWQLIALVIAALLLVLLVWSWDARGRQIDALNLQITQYEETLKQVREANETLVARLSERNQEVTRQLSLIGRIQRAPESENGPVAPVLRSTLDELRNNRQTGQRGSPTNTPSN